MLDLATLDGTNGVRLDGVDALDNSGVSVSDAGDVNGDGFDDIIVGAYHANGFAGESYVVFGRAGGIPASFDLAALDGSNGFRLDGPASPAYGTYSGFSVSSAGDFNGDGFDDVIVGAYYGNPATYAGESYIVFGKADGFAASLALGRLGAPDGVRIKGADSNDKSGYSVSSAGDVNGDGFDDVIIGAPGAGSGGGSFVVFGRAGEIGSTLDLGTLDGTNGFRIDGIDSGDDSGVSVSNAGDLNGDGFDDIIVGAPYADPEGRSRAGESYVVFGQAGGFAPSLDLAALDGNNGFRIDGIGGGDNSGGSVSSAGDVNGDGLDDVIVGAAGAGAGGESYVIFGRSGGFASSLDLASLDGTNGFRIVGAGDSTGASVSSAGDVNGDGFDDVIVGSPTPFFADETGDAYVVFGKAGGYDPSLDLSTLDGTNGFRIAGIDPRDDCGRSVSAAGDVNGDGFDDIIVGAPDGDAGGGNSGESYVIFGRAPDEAVRRLGSAADQTIRGGDFDDLLNGRGGDDTLAGGVGNDRLRGGAGADDFLLASRSATDADTIFGFGRGEDRIALDGSAFGLGEGALGADRFAIGTAAADASDRLIYNDATGQLFFDADGAGTEAQILIATLTGAPPLAAVDFVVI